MFAQTLSSALSSLSPLWSNELVKALSLSNEYSLAINMVLTVTIKYITEYLSDELALCVTLIIASIYILSYYKIKVINFSQLFKQAKHVTTIGTEKHNNGIVSFTCSKAFKSLNLMLIHKYNFKNLKYLKDTNFDIIVNDVTDYQLETDLYVTVKRDILNKDIIYIILSSYNEDIHQIIQDAINIYDDDNKKYKLTLVGNEDNGTTYNYPITMKYITYTLVNIYKMEKLKILDEIHTKNGDNRHMSEAETKSDKVKNATSTAKEALNDSVQSLEDDLKNIYLLEDCKEFPLNDNIFLTIERTTNIVTYTLVSDTTNLQDFLKQCIAYYKQDISISDHKYALKISGFEKITTDSSSIKYPKNLIALCHTLIHSGAVNNFRMVEIDGQPVKIIDKITNLVFNDIIINVIRKVQTQNYWDSFMHVTYILESDTVNLNEYIVECEEAYDTFLNEKNDNILYYFKYLGKFNNELKFSKTILSGPDNMLYETFDNIYNEHTNILKNDIMKLKDLEYYKKTGLRRKKSYLFHGEPGCGKNASVTAMALFDNRHIIDVPFGILQYNSELNELMNLSSINGISFKKEQIIMMFDEMHTGLLKITSNQLTEQNEEKDKQTKEDAIFNAITNDVVSTKSSNTTYDTLDLGCVLSLLDGIGNYGGIIYVGLTNYIDKIPLPLKRSLRLTPVYFTYLRREDTVSIINSFFEVSLSEKEVNLLPDRKITPAKLRLLCEHNSTKEINEFIDVVITEAKNDTTASYAETDNTEKYSSMSNAGNSTISKGMNYSPPEEKSAGGNNMSSMVMRFA